MTKPPIEKSVKEGNAEWAAVHAEPVTPEGEAGAAAAELTSSPVVLDQFPAIVPDEDGYYHAADWIRVECDWPGLAPRDGFKPLWAEIDANLTFDDAEAIPDIFNTPFGQLYRHVCPRVRAWNARGIDQETGRLRLVPPPAEIGADAFRAVKPTIMLWLAYTLKTIHLGGGPNRPKETSS